jgi:hypothetical protein
MHCPGACGSASYLTNKQGASDFRLRSDSRGQMISEQALYFALQSHHILFTSGLPANSAAAEDY